MAGIGHGVKLERGDRGDPTEVWTSIGKVVDPDYPTLSRDAVESTTTESTNKYREFIGGLRDAGEVSPTLELDTGDAVYTALIADYNTDADVHYRVVSPDGNEAWDFNGLITSIDHDVPLDDRLTVTVTIKISGQPSLVTLP